MATENALKVQISQLETTLKSDLNDKNRLTEALGREREAFAQMESDFKDLQSKFLAMKEEAENQEDQLHNFAQVILQLAKSQLAMEYWCRSLRQVFAQEHSVEAGELEAALLQLRREQLEPPRPRSGRRTSSLPRREEPPPFLAQLDTEHRDVKTELSELQVQHIEAINELEKTRNLLRVQVKGTSCELLKLI